MLEILQENLIAITCSGIASFATGTLVWVIKRMRGLFVAVRADSRDKIRRFGKFYILTNQVTMEELEDLGEIYKGYHDLGGNGTITEIYERCLDLPIVKERTKWNPYYVGADGFTGK